MSQVDIELNELIKLSAVDSRLFSQAFFPKTVRQQPPFFHKEIWDLIDSPARYVNIEIFRGGAKTTLLRILTAKRTAYRISRTILYVGKSQSHASRSLLWLQKQIEQNTKFAQTFGLVKGTKWNSEEMEVVSTVDGTSTWIVAFGITGSTRGLNFDDYRPDLIIVDDVVDKRMPQILNSAIKQKS